MRGFGETDMKRSEHADAWLQQAEHDIGAARLLRSNGYWDTCALMCQQAAEKAIKAVWIDVKGSAPPKVHWVERLAEELGAPQDIVDAASMLVAEYTASRYPDALASPAFQLYSDDDSDERLGYAESIIGWAESQWEEEDGTENGR